MGVFNNFPYTNFHELNMDWIIEQVRNVIDEWNQYKTDMDLWKVGVDEEITKFRTWFDNLDVQDEVRTVINELIASGDFLTITGPQISQFVSEWLAANITPTTPVVDASLSVSGAAADAAVTGAIRAQLMKYNAYNFAGIRGDMNNVVENGITWNCINGDFTVSGTASSTSFVRLLYSQTDRKRYMTNGKTYKVLFNPQGTTPTGIRIQVTVYKEGLTEPLTLYDANHSGSFTMPNDDTYVGIQVRLVVSTGQTTDSYFIAPAIMDTATNAELEAALYQHGVELEALENFKKKSEGFNTVNALLFSDVAEKIDSGITYSVSNNVVTAAGTATAIVFQRAFYSLTEFPDWLERGKTYRVRIEKTGDMARGGLQIVAYRNGSASNYEYLFNSAENGTVTIPEDAAYTGMLIRWFIQGGATVDGTMKLAMTNALSTEELTESVERSKRLFQHKAVFFGASEILGRLGTTIDGRNVTQYKIPDTVTKIVEIECDNKGVGGLGYMRQSDNTEYANAYALISTTDITEYDTVFMIYGGNDGFYPAGEWNSTDESTCMGQFNKIINYLYATKPNLSVVVFAPMNGRNAGSFPTYWYGTPGGSATSRSILSNALKTACEYYGIPYIEQTTSPVNGFTIREQTVIGADGVHLTEYGYQRVGEWIAGQIAKLIG